MAGANMGPTWDLWAPDGPHVGLMNLSIRLSALTLVEFDAMMWISPFSAVEIIHEKYASTYPCLANHASNMTTISHICFTSFDAYDGIYKKKQYKSKYHTFHVQAVFVSVEPHLIGLILNCAPLWTLHVMRINFSGVPCVRPSLTIARALQNIARKYTMPEITYMPWISSWNVVCGHTYKVSVWNSHK